MGDRERQEEALAGLAIAEGVWAFFSFFVCLFSGEYWGIGGNCGTYISGILGRNYGRNSLERSDWLTRPFSSVLGG